MAYPQDMAMTVINWLKMLRDDYHCVPRSKEGAKLAKPSNSELHRWCKKSSVLLNGVKVQPKDEVPDWVWQLTFFPKNDKARCSVVWEEINIVTEDTCNPHLTERHPVSLDGSDVME